VQLEPGQYRPQGCAQRLSSETPTARAVAEQWNHSSTLSKPSGIEGPATEFCQFAGDRRPNGSRPPEGEPLAGATVAVLAVDVIAAARQQGPVPTGREPPPKTDDLGQITRHRPTFRRADNYVRLRARSIFNHGEGPVDHSPKGGPPLETFVPTFYPASRDFGPPVAEAKSRRRGPCFTGWISPEKRCWSRMYRVCGVQWKGRQGSKLGCGTCHERPGTGRRFLHQSAIQTVNAWSCSSQACRRVPYELTGLRVPELESAWSV